MSTRDDDRLAALAAENARLREEVARLAAERADADEDEDEDEDGWTD